MKGQWKLITGLVVFVLVLGGLATWDERETAKEKEAEQTKNRLVNFKVEDVISFDATLTPADGQIISLQLKKGETGWAVVSPVAYPADQATVDAVLKTLGEFSYAKAVASDAGKWGDYGVDEAGHKVTLGFKDANVKPVTVYLGKKAPVGYNGYYRASSSDQVYIGSQHLLVSFNKSLDDFRERSLSKLVESEIATVWYSKGKDRLEFKKGEAGFELTSGASFKADSEAVRELIRDVGGVRVASFVDSPSTEWLKVFATPLSQLGWTSPAGVTKVLSFAEKDGKLYAAFDAKERVFGLPDDVKVKVSKETSEFRNRRFLEPQALDVAKVTVDGESYTKVQGDWYLAADAVKFDDKGEVRPDVKDKPVEQSHIRNLLVDMEFAKAEQFLSSSDKAVAKTMQSAPDHKLDLSYADQTKPHMIVELFKAADEGFYLVRRTGSVDIYRVAKSAFKSVTPESPSANALLNDVPEAG